MNERILPGKEEARKKGYVLSSFAGDGSSATYGREGIMLCVQANGQASLSSQVGLLTLTTGWFQWPHPRFEMFEQHMESALAAIESVFEEAEG